MSEKNKQKRPLDLSRRNFLKTAAVAGFTVTTTGALAKKVSSLVFDDSRQMTSRNYLLQGDGIMINRKYVLMSKAEKQTLLRTFIENYKNSPKTDI
jgi:hypothetical protein